MSDRQRDIYRATQRRRRNKMRDDGFKLKQVWVHPDEVDRWTEFVASLKAYQNENHPDQKQ